MITEKIFAGIDGGGTKTAGVLLDGAGRILARTRAGRSAIFGDPSPESSAVLASVMQTLCADAGIGRDQVTGIVLGLNGIDFADEYPRQFSMLSACLDAPNAELTLVNDGIPALWGASPEEQAAIVQHGSGITCAYRTAVGQERTFDHLGVGRQFDLRQQVAALVARMIDGRYPATPLKEAVLRHYGIDDEKDFAEQLYRQRIPREIFRTATRAVFASWQDAGDPAATELVHAAADDYACTACVLIAATGDPRCHLAFGGGVIHHAPAAFFDVLVERVHAKYPETRVTRPRLTAEFGAAIMAAFRAGENPRTLFQTITEQLSSEERPV
ncbi:MAG TPA: BadF/BadG/BcrA/BcrD ATPase family protein [Armatimonadota bacterium]|jgi:N-acetylglucosamine kinase-like BadF-type ATPase